MSPLFLAFAAVTGLWFMTWSALLTQIALQVSWQARAGMSAVMGWGFCLLGRLG